MTESGSVKNWLKPSWHCSSELETSDKLPTAAQGTDKKEISVITQHSFDNSSFKREVSVAYHHLCKNALRRQKGICRFQPQRYEDVHK